MAGHHPQVLAQGQDHVHHPGMGQPGERDDPYVQMAHLETQLKMREWMEVAMPGEVMLELLEG